MRRLLTENHEPRKKQLQHIREAIGIARSLLQAGVLERLPEPEPDGRRYDLTARPAAGLRAQPAAVDVRAGRDRAARPRRPTPTPLDVVERHRGDPRRPAADPRRPAEQGQGRGRRADEGRGHRVRRADGAARGGHLPEAARGAARRTPSRCTVQTNPWAADAQLSPKSVVREMWERAFTFREFVNTYGLTRSEGAVLRYLSDAFKALRSGVPAVGPHRGGHRPRRVARRAGAPGRLVAARRVGAADLARPAARRSRSPCRPGRAR